MNSGSNGDMFAAYVSRFIVIGALSYIAWTTTQSKDGVQQLRNDAIRDREKIQEIQNDMKKYATKDEMNSAEQRIQISLDEKIRKYGRVISTTDHGQNYEK